MLAISVGMSTPASRWCCAHVANFRLRWPTMPESTVTIGLVVVVLLLLAVGVWWFRRQQRPTPLSQISTPAMTQGSPRLFQQQRVSAAKASPILEAGRTRRKQQDSEDDDDLDGYGGPISSRSQCSVVDETDEEDDDPPESPHVSERTTVSGRSIPPLFEYSYSTDGTFGGWKPKGNRRAVIVGINYYDAKDVKPLRGKKC